jgi:hypothetical protein
MAKKTGSSPTAKRNRQTARSLKFKGTKDARDAGVPLPTKQEIDDQEMDSTRPRIPAYKPTRKNHK